MPLRTRPLSSILPHSSRPELCGSPTFPIHFTNPWFFIFLMTPSWGACRSISGQNLSLYSLKVNESESLWKAISKGACQSLDRSVHSVENVENSNETQLKMEANNVACTKVTISLSYCKNNLPFTKRANTNPRPSEEGVFFGSKFRPHFQFLLPMN